MSTDQCPHCMGCNTMDAWGEAPDGAKRWMKCLSCGNRWDAEEEPMGRGPWTEEQRRKHAETIRKRKGLPPAEEEPEKRPEPPALIPLNGKEVVVHMRGQMVGVTMIDDLITQTREDLAALERVQGILARQP